ncbi:hypothetical protein [Methylobacterium gnaphalii]|nr:hypothetical protein [Methylobacterium gnaphalii]
MGDRYGVPGRSFSELRDIVRYSGKKVTIEDLICNKEDLLTTEFGIEQFDNFETNFKSRIQEMLQTIPDINERRKKRAFLIKHGKLRRGDIFPLMKNHSEQLLASAEKELPELAPLFSDGGMIEYMAKKN